MTNIFFLAGLLAASCQSQAQTPKPLSTLTGFQSGPSMAYDPQIITTLLKLMEERDRTRPSNEDFKNSSLKDILRLGTPAGFHLRNRYIHLGVSLAEALSATDDKRLKDQLLELARWERSEEIRAVALRVLAIRREPQSLPVFREALVNIKPEVRFAALEAMEIWDQPGAKEELAKVIRIDLSPVVRIYAAKVLFRYDAAAALQTLRTELESSGDWLARAMAARYLGDLGEGEDYDRMLNRISIESTNDFVLAEAAIAALKLFPKKSAGGVFSAGAASADERPTAAPPPPSGASFVNLFVELEPLEITAPRLKIPPTLLIDGRVNAVLLRLLESKADERPKEEDLNDSSIKVLNSLVSQNGFLLRIRYTELGFLLTEGLAGTADLILRDKILRVARQGSNPQVRAAAMVAVAYNKDPGDRGIFQEALMSQDITVRFGALEALLIWNQPGVLNDVSNVARMDASLPVRAWAAAALLRQGEGAGRDILVRLADDSDWLARAMAYRYLGELGVSEDFEKIMFNLGRESNNFVQSEMCGTLLRLYSRRPPKP